MIKKTSKGKKGVYEGIVSFTDSRGVVHTKGNKSTFFPDGWSLGTVKEEVRRALYKSLEKGNYSGLVVEKGIKVEMRILNGKVITAYLLLTTL